MKSYSVSRIQTKLNFADGFYNIFQNRILKVKQRNGSVLILAIWVMSLLVFFAVYIGLNIRQKASLLLRIEKKSEL
ncbi:MAG: hypothetical protein KC733_10845, partial [Candidatus Omnitrophica bacterium]|nr:hypothetical protein [Candidatus Omnitrophota bacterium]